jgi:S1-C subfamily serine protease
LGGLAENALATLGISVKYPDDIPQGATILGFQTDSTAQAAQLQLFDFVLEVDGSAVGLIRNRYYQLWQHYGRTANKKTELLVSFVKADGSFAYYYPQVDQTPIDAVQEYRAALFTLGKPVARNAPEDRDANIARYQVGASDFEQFGQYELGVNVSYSSAGVTIEDILPGKQAEKAGLQVGDIILEVDGAPVGVFGDRTYEFWRQYSYSKTGNVEFLISFGEDAQGQFKYYYPIIQLDPLTAPA